MMNKGSSCIAIISRYADASIAADKLVVAGVDEDTVSLVGIDSQQGEVARSGLGCLDDDLSLLGVLKTSICHYKCLLEAGFCLLIVRGNHQQIEHACTLLEQHDQMDVSMHFNSD